MRGLATVDEQGNIINFQTLTGNFSLLGELNEPNTSKNDEQFIMSEGKGAFEDTARIPSGKVQAIYKEFTRHLEEIGAVNESKIDGLGSTRPILEGESGAPNTAGDIDLVVAASEESSISSALEELKQHFSSQGMETNRFFGNIFSVSFNGDSYGQNVQIDVMVARPDPEDRMYRYLRDLKFFSPVTDTERDFQVKGLHRTELIKKLAKAVGLSFARDGLAAYTWSPEHQTYESFMERLENKYSRTRKEENKKRLQELIGYIQTFDSLSEIKEEMFKATALAEEKIFSNRLGVGPVFGTYASKTVEKELAEKKYFGESDWVEVLEHFFSQNDVENRVRTLPNVLELVEERAGTEIPEKDVKRAFRVYKEKLQEDGYWSGGLRQMIVRKLPFLKGVV